jgi:hypothetical protein
MGHVGRYRHGRHVASRPRLKADVSHYHLVPYRHLTVDWGYFLILTFEDNKSSGRGLGVAVSQDVEKDIIGKGLTQL